MQIKPVAGPHVISQGSQNDFAKAQATRQAAIAAYSGQPAQQVVQNQSQVSVEEMGAIRAPNRSEQQSDQSPRIEESQPEIPTPNVDTKATQPEDPTLSRQFAQLAKQERQLRLKVQQQEQAMKVREAAIKAKEEAYSAKDQEYSQKYIQKDFLKNNPLQALAEAQVSYDELTQQIINSSTPQDPRLLATISKLEAKISQLEKTTEETTNNWKSEKDSQRVAAVKQIRSEVTNLVNSDPNFETIKATKSYNDVVELIERTFDEDGILLSVEEAANEVENYILEEAVKLSRLSKVSKKALAAGSPSQPSKQPVEQSTQPKAQSAPQPMRTLTNATASTRPLTAKERAMLAFKGQLK